MSKIKTPQELLDIVKKEHEELLKSNEDKDNLPRIILTTEDKSDYNIVLAYEKDKRFPDKINSVYYLENKSNKNEKPTLLKSEEKLLTNIKMHFDYIKEHYEKDILRAKGMDVSENEQKKTEQINPEQKDPDIIASYKQFFNTDKEKQTQEMVTEVFKNAKELKNLNAIQVFSSIEKANPKFMKEEYIYNAIDYRLESFNYLPEDLKSQKVCEYMLDSIQRKRFISLSMSDNTEEGRANKTRSAFMIKKLINNIPESLKEVESIKKKCEQILNKYEIEKIIREERMKKENEHKTPENEKKGTEKKEKSTEKREQQKKDNNNKDKTVSEPNSKEKKEKPEVGEVETKVKKDSIFRKLINFIKNMIEKIRYRRLVKYNERVSFEKEYEQAVKKEEKANRKEELEKAQEQQKIKEIEAIKKGILENEKSTEDKVLKLSQLAVGKGSTIIVPLNNGQLKMTPRGKTVRIEVGKNEVKETPTGGYAAKFRETDLIAFKNLKKYPNVDLTKTINAIMEAGDIKDLEQEKTSEEIEVKDNQGIETQENDKKNEEKIPETKNNENLENNVKNTPFYELAKRDVPELNNENIDKVIEIFNKKDIQGKNNDVIYKLSEEKAVVISRSKEGPVFHIQDKQNSEKLPLTKENYEKHIQPLIKESAPLVNQKFLNKDTIEYTMEKMIADTKEILQKEPNLEASAKGNIKTEIFRDKEENNFIILSTYQNDKGDTLIKGVYKNLLDDVNFSLNMNDVQTKGVDAVLENRQDLMERISQVFDEDKKIEYAKAFDIPMEELREVTTEIDCKSNTEDREREDQRTLENESPEETLEDDGKTINDEFMENQYDESFFENDVEIE